MREVVVERVTALSKIGYLDRLVEASVRDGRRMLVRLVADYDAGTNRFDRPGERLVVARREGRLIGIVGLNVDPFLDDARVARIRRLFVDPAERRRGVARALIQALLVDASVCFDRVRVRAGTAEAGPFYDALGFERVDEADATHALGLGAS